MGPFALYTAAACEPAQQVQAGQVFDLSQPVANAGATLFRRSLWLPVAAAALGADALRLAEGSTLALRFEALEVDAATSDAAWLPECIVANDLLRLSLALPVPIVELVGTRSLDFELHRRDGEAVTDQALTSGRLNTRLAEPVDGVSFALHLPEYFDTQWRKSAQAPPIHMKAKSFGVQTAQSDFAMADDLGVIDILQAARHDGVLRALRLAGKPTSPRVRLVRPGSGGAPEETLWLELRAGEQTSPQTLPADAPATAWAPALEHCLASAEEKKLPIQDLVLRLDLESDAPCRVTVQAASLALDADTELLADPITLRFSGSCSEALAVRCAPPSGPVTQITISAAPGGDAAGAALGSAALPGNGRTGTLLGPDQRLVRALDLAGPVRLAGITLPWHPLSDQAIWAVQLCADGGDQPSRATLLEASVSADTPAAAWVALRWPPLDLQGGRFWLRVAAKSGSGLWLHAESAPAVAGWVEAAQAPELIPAPLGGVPALGTLSPSDAPPAIVLHVGNQALTLSAAAPGKKPKAQHGFSPPVVLGDAFTVEASQPLTLKIESVRATQRL